MNKYKVGQVLRILGGLSNGCTLSSDLIGKFFEVISNDTENINSGWLREWHRDEDYMCIKGLMNGWTYCINENANVEVMPFSIGEEVKIVNQTSGHRFEIGDTVKIVGVTNHKGEDEDYVIKISHNDLIQYVSMSDLGFNTSNPNILIINNKNEVTYYEDGKEVKTSIEESVLQEFLNKLKPAIPHLELEDDDYYYGEIGEATILIDSLGAPLFVGDVVETYRNGNKLDNCFIVKEDDSGAFVYGWAVSMSELAVEENYFNEEIKIRKIKSFEELENGYKLDGIKVVK